MRHKMLSLFALTLVLALAAGTALMAQDTTTATGKVTNVDTSANTITVTTASGTSETFSTDSQSMYMSNGRTINLNNLKVGDQVTITYRNDTGGKMTATHVDVVTSGTPSPGTTYNNPSDNNNGAATDTYKKDTYRNDTNTTGSTYRNDTNTGSTYDRDRNTTTDSQLPRTGSPLPLIGLAAGLFGAAALALAGFRRFAF